MKQSWPYLMIVVALFLVINGAALFSDGMFMDGLFYSTISRNLAEGQGSFWDLYFSNTFFTHFHEHPPLAMGLQSLFFKTFGDSIYVERFYSLIIYFTSLFLMTKIWKLIVEDTYKHYYWLPLFLYSIIGVVGWSVSNNMLENTMTIFVLLSFYLSLKSMDLVDFKMKSLFIILAGFVLFLGFLTKGFVALFPLSTLFFFGTFTKRITFYRSVLDSFIMLLGLTLPILFLYLFNDIGIKSLMTYFNTQVAASIKNVSTVSSRFWILWSAIQQLLPVILFCLICYLISLKIKKLNNKPSTFFYPVLFIGLSGIVPIMISLKQRDFYIVSAYAIICIAFSLFILPYFHTLIQRFESLEKFNLYLKRVSVFLLIISLTIIGFQNNRIGRDKNMVKDIKIIGNIVPKGSVILIPAELSNNWSLRGYFARYNHIGLTPDLNQKSNYYLSNKEIEIEGFVKLDSLQLSDYHIYSNLIK